MALGVPILKHFRVHCYFSRSFFRSVVAGGTSHFYSFFFVNILARVDFLV